MNEKIQQLCLSRKFPLSIAGAAMLAVAVLLIMRSGKARAGSNAAIDAESIPSVGVVKATREDLARIIRIPAEFRPYTKVELHAKVSGYLDKMNVDFGDRVKAGQLLTTIEVPELQDELTNAAALEQQAEADYTNANLIYTRLIGVNQAHPNLVAQQDIDTATAKNFSAKATLAAAKADVGKFQTLISYTQINAPFDGVVTHRYVDPGALVEAGTASANTQPLLEISDNYRLRLDFPVSVDDVKDIKEGDSVDVSIDSMRGKTLTGTITRYTRRVDDTTRTMTVEMEVPNSDLELVPGMYATVILKVDRRPNAVAIPTEAIPPGKTSVYVVNSNNEVEERSVTLGLETPTKYEVLSGLNAGDLVMVGNPAQVGPSQKVEPKLINLLAEQ